MKASSRIPSFLPKRFIGPCLEWGVLFPINTVFLWNWTDPYEFCVCFLWNSCDPTPQTLMLEFIHFSIVFQNNHSFRPCLEFKSFFLFLLFLLKNELILWNSCAIHVKFMCSKWVLKTYMFSIPPIANAFLHNSPFLFLCVLHSCVLDGLKF